jgi:hypothetical protein
MPDSAHTRAIPCGVRRGSPQLRTFEYVEEVSKKSMALRFLLHPPLSRKRVLVSLVAATLLAATLATVHPASATTSHPLSHTSGHFCDNRSVFYSTAANTVQNYAISDDPLPIDDSIVVAPSWDHGGVWISGDTHPLGV